MTVVNASIEIAVAPDVVFATILDPNRLADWVTIHRSVKVKSANPTAEGSEMDQVLSLHGLSVTIHWTLTSVQAPTEAQWHGRGPAGSRAAIRYCLSGPAEGPTRFDYANEFTAPGGPIGKAASRVVVGPASAREANRSLAKLKALLEH
ncbi:SRPBCC family protein [Conexibacter sp. DBS9H8]|uniref:SRPBCC family protein n=1 Tax=Conexibacter sp. DBS9H8 TaxID=2937801 RepID=UPI00200FE3D9|nr:SRPBCC family protein [Conexibacter sp. DBS9H8]